MSINTSVLTVEGLKILMVESKTIHQCVIAVVNELQLNKAKKELSTNDKLSIVIQLNNSYAMLYGLVNSGELVEMLSAYQLPWEDIGQNYVIEAVIKLRKSLKRFYDY